MSLEDKQAITEVLYRYARAVDRLDLEGIADCYHPDARDRHGAYDGDIPGLIADIAERHRTIDYAQHFITNVLIDFDGPDTAYLEASCLCYLRQERAEGAEEQELMTIKCRYVDRFERRDGAWKVADRVVAFDEVQRSMIRDHTPDGFVRGRRDRTDPVYTRRGVSA